MSSAFSVWVALIVIGALAASALSWRVHQARVRRNRDGRCARCGSPLEDGGVRRGGVMLCARCAGRPRPGMTVAVRAIVLLVVLGSVATAWAMRGMWVVNRRGAWFVFALWLFYAGALIFFAFRYARDARNAERRRESAERSAQAAHEARAARAEHEANLERHGRER